MQRNAPFLQIKCSLCGNCRTHSKHTQVPDFISHEPVANIEDLNVMAPDSIVQNKPIKYLRESKPTRENVSSGSWGLAQRMLMEEMDKEYDKLAKFMIDKF